MNQVLFDCSSIGDQNVSVVGVDPELLYALVMWALTLSAKTDMHHTAG